MSPFRLLAFALPVVLLPLQPALARPDSPDSEAALHEGNRLFRAGQLPAAMEAYMEGFDPRAPHPLLAYNLGTTAHHLGRLPEALLWYRRAALQLAGDPWLRDNLALVREALAATRLPPPGPLGWAVRHRRGLLVAGTALAWLALTLVALWRQAPGWMAAALAILALLLFGAGAALGHWGPRAAVLLEDCGDGPFHLAAGSEVWVWDDGDGEGEGWGVLGAPGDLRCPTVAVGLVEP